MPDAAFGNLPLDVEKISRPLRRHHRLHLQSYLYPESLGQSWATV